MKKLLLGLILSLLSTSAIMAQSFQSNDEETVRNALTLHMSCWNSKVYLEKLCIPLYVATPQNGTVKFCWYDTKMVFGEKVRTGEKPSRTEEGTYVNGRLSMYKRSDNDIYKFNWVNTGNMVLLESIVRYRGDGSEIDRYTREYYPWEKEKTISSRASNHHTRSISMSNALITKEYGSSDGTLILEGYQFYGGRLRQKYARGEYIRRNWQQSAGEQHYYQQDYLNITPDGRFSRKGLSDEELYDLNDPVRCECYVY